MKKKEYKIFTERKTIKYFAKKLCKKLPSSSLDQLDFEQELTLSLFIAEQKFDPKDTTYWKKFAREVLLNTYKDLLKSHFTQKRKHELSMLDFDEKYHTPSLIEEENIISEGTIKKFFRLLSKKEQILLEDLKIMNFNEIAKKNIEPVKTLYTRFRRLQKKNKKFFIKNEEFPFCCRKCL